MDLSFATIGESQGVGAGTGGLGGAAAGFAAGVVAAGLGGAVDAAGFSADGFESPGGVGGEGDLVSSGMSANAQTSGAESYGENVNFYQLGDVVSTCRWPANADGSRANVSVLAFLLRASFCGKFTSHATAPGTAR